MIRVAELGDMYLGSKEMVNYEPFPENLLSIKFYNRNTNDYFKGFRFGKEKNRELTHRICGNIGQNKKTQGSDNMFTLEVGAKFIDVIDYKIDLQDFGKWLYSHENIQSELSSDEYLDLVSFNYQGKINHYEIRQFLINLFDKYHMENEPNYPSNCIRGTCITNVGKYDFENTDRNFNITVGKIYDVLSIHYSKLEDFPLKCQYVIIDDDERIYYIPSSLLKLDTMIIPNEWIIEDHGGGSLTIEPKLWNTMHYKGELSFWEDFYDSKEYALFEFVRVLQKMNIKIPDKFRYIGIKLMYKSSV